MNYLQQLKANKEARERRDRDNSPWKRVMMTMDGGMMRLDSGNAKQTLVEFVRTLNEEQSAQALRQLGAIRTDSSTSPASNAGLSNDEILAKRKAERAARIHANGNLSTMGSSY